MSRVRSSTVRKKRHKKWIKRTKGYRGTRKNLFKVAKIAAFKALGYATRDRRVRKRAFRRLWITRIRAACNANGISYSKFIKNLNREKVLLNRKILADMAVFDAEAFSLLVKQTMK
jgi:large subunit ribosomal protein L20